MSKDTKYEVLELDRVTVGVVSQTLAQMGLALNQRANKITFQNVDARNIHIAIGQAPTAASYLLLPTGGTDKLKVSPRRGATLQFISIGGNSTMNVVQEGG